MMNNNLITSINKKFEAVRIELDLIKKNHFDYDSIKTNIDNITSKMNKNIQMFTTIKNNSKQEIDELKARVAKLEELLNCSNPIQETVEEPVEETVEEPVYEESSEEEIDES